MFYLVSSGLPAAAVVLLKSGLTSGLTSRALLVSLSPGPSLQVTRALLVWLRLLPSATCLGYVLPRISSSYFWDVTLVSADGAFPRSSIIDHCLILAFRIHLMLLWPVMMLWFLTGFVQGNTYRGSSVSPISRPSGSRNSDPRGNKRVMFPR